MTTIRKPGFFNTALPNPTWQEMDPANDNFQAPKVILTGDGGVALDAGSNRVINVATPTAANDAVTKAYADLIAAGVRTKLSCKAAATTNVASLVGLLTVDGVTLAANDRVLLTGQTTASQNGVWLAQVGGWTRPTDFATGASASGDLFTVTGGTANSGSQWVCISPVGSDTVDTDPLTFTEYSGASDVIAGNGLTKNVNTLSILLATNPGLQFTSAALDLLLVSGGGLTKGASGLQVLLDPDNNITSSVAGLKAAGVPTLFNIGGVATSANVTAPNLNTLTAGPSSVADALHTHTQVTAARTLIQLANNGAAALNLGDPVYWSTSANTLGKCDASSSATTAAWGLASVAALASAANVPIIFAGLLVGCLSGAAPGKAVYVASGGGLTQTVLGSPNSLVLVGYAKNTTDLQVIPPMILVQR